MKHNRVLIFSTDDHLYPAGGAEQAMGNITERLPHIEFDLICAKLRRGVKECEHVKNVHIHRVGFGVPKIDGIILALFGHLYARKLMRRHTYDLVWSIMASYGAFSAVRVKRQSGLPFLLTLQEGDSFEYIYERVKYVRGSFNKIFATADGIQAISQYLLRWGREMGYRGKFGVVIPNGVSIGLFSQPIEEQKRNEIRSAFAFPEDSFVLITSSRLERKNGVGDIIAALAKLPVNVCLVICGSGSLEKILRTQVAALGLSRRVLFKGFVQPEALPALMKSSDAFIRPSLTEGLGNAFLEAMAARIPVIGTHAGGISDFLIDGETGFVVEIESPESIAHVVGRVMNLSHTEREALLNRSERCIHDRYDWDRIAKQMEDLCNQLTT